jgi:hypothetical protein
MTSETIIKPNKIKIVCEIDSFDSSMYINFSLLSHKKYTKNQLINFYHCLMVILYHTYSLRGYDDCLYLRSFPLALLFHFNLYNFNNANVPCNVNINMDNNWLNNLIATVDKYISWALCSYNSFCPLCSSEPESIFNSFNEAICR